MLVRVKTLTLTMVLAAVSIDGAMAAAKRSSLPQLTTSAVTGYARTASLPDLAVDSVIVRLADECRPSAPLFYVTARVSNQGATVARATDTLVYAVGGAAQNWGNGIHLSAPSAGLSEQVTFPVYFLKNEPESMAGTHQFVVGIRDSSIAESDSDNNQVGPISVTIPDSLCQSI